MNILKVNLKMIKSIREVSTLYITFIFNSYGGTEVDPVFQLEGTVQRIFIEILFKESLEDLIRERDYRTT